MAEKLTNAQARLAHTAADGHGLRQEFDVWGGYWWTENGAPVGTTIAMRLKDAGMIHLGCAIRVESGRSFRVASLTPAGRAALALSSKDETNG